MFFKLLDFFFSDFCHWHVSGAKHGMCIHSHKPVIIGIWAQFCEAAQKFVLSLKRLRVTTPTIWRAWKPSGKTLTFGGVAEFVLWGLFLTIFGGVDFK